MSSRKPGTRGPGSLSSVCRAQSFAAPARNSGVVGHRDPRAAKITNTLVTSEAMRNVCDNHGHLVFLSVTGAYSRRHRFQRYVKLCASLVSFDFQQSHPRNCDQQAQRLRRVQGGSKGLHGRGEARHGVGASGVCFISVMIFPSFLHFWNQNLIRLISG